MEKIIEEIIALNHRLYNGDIYGTCRGNSYDDVEAKKLVSKKIGRSLSDKDWKEALFLAQEKETKKRTPVKTTKKGVKTEKVNNK